MQTTESSSSIKLFSRGSALALLAVILLTVKLVVVSQREMALVSNDSVDYVVTSLKRLSIFAFHNHPPGTSYVIWCARAFGIPYRVFEEIILALMMFLFLRPLVVYCRSGLFIAIPVFMLIMFNPNLVRVMDIPLSEPPYFLILLAGLGGVMGWIFAPRDRLPIFSIALTVAAFGFLAVIRDDGPILWFEMAATAAFSLIFLRTSEGWRFRRGVVACSCAVAANLMVGQAMSAAAYSSHGYWGTSAVQSREWWGLYSALLALPVPRTQRHAFINKQDLDLAASLSPTFAKYSSCLQEIGGKADNFKILNSRIQWRLGRCTDWEINEFNRMRAEIIEGARVQGIKLRWPVLGIIPKPVSQWVPSLVPSTLHVLDEVNSNPTTLVAPMNQFESRDRSGPNKERLFNKALLRRSSLAKNSKNPEFPAYKQFFVKIYSLVSPAGLIATGFILLTALCLLLTGLPRVGDQLVFFGMTLVSFDIATRIGYYTMVDWIVWSIPSRYVLPSQVLLAFSFVSIVVILIARLWATIRRRQSLEAHHGNSGATEL